MTAVETEPAFAPGTYRITFDRIGRHHDVDPLITHADSGEHLAGLIQDYARRYCRSAEVDAYVRYIGDGAIVVGGFRDAGSFAWTRIGDDA